MAFTVVFSNGEPRDYGVFDKYEVTDAGVLLIEMHREDVNRHYIGPGGWLGVIEMADGMDSRSGCHEGSSAIDPNRFRAQRVWLMHAQTATHNQWRLKNQLEQHSKELETA